MTGRRCQEDTARIVLLLCYAVQHRKFAHGAKWICVPMWNAL